MNNSLLNELTSVIIPTQLGADVILGKEMQELRWILFVLAV